MAHKPVLLISRRLPDPVHERAARDYDAHLNPEDRQYGGLELAEAAARLAADALMVTPTEKVTREVIEALPDSVRVLATFSVGHDHIDTDAARARGLTVTNTPDVVTEATADIALLCLLGAARRAWEAESLLRRGDWTGWAPTQLLGVHPGGRRLGILGMGRIGMALARRARALGMELHYCKRTRLPEGEEADLGLTWHDTSESLLRVSDFLSIHIPGSADNHHYLNAERIGLLPKGAVVINTARGTVVDDAALIAALKDGRVQAAGLDVFEGEPAVNPGYLDLPNAFLLPHLGTATLETRTAMGFRALDNVDAVVLRRAEPGDRVV
ncbi:D-3-phosphoglycerate dehydrogenase [Caenispirillum salinarum AK4]|uniref:D-3-phosphoglycerate dehydrogenase n=1 Tax=Caenispirillum salinarum AK4 TaxID=1238182 RepID=K9HMB3_9PROT|nr:D-glycerate dehydrogenase [Caenispirillum salinarum]EKV31488.1 D-3-phosphoglycerate dehydrogenase [Caenispirillum salinarum AK4]